MAAPAGDGFAEEESRAMTGIAAAAARNTISEPIGSWRGPREPVLTTQRVGGSRDAPTSRAPGHRWRTARRPPAQVIGSASPSYIALISPAYLSTMTRRLSLSVGVSSSLSAVHSAGRIVHF